jgi:hypothetical protein
MLGASRFGESNRLGFLPLSLIPAAPPLLRKFPEICPQTLSPVGGEEVSARSVYINTHTHSRELPLSAYFW